MKFAWENCAYLKPVEVLELLGVMHGFVGKNDTLSLLFYLFPFERSANRPTKARFGLKTTL
jgi:hypothetical protein